MAARTLLFLPFGLVLLLYIRNLLALVADESGREGIHEGIKIVSWAYGRGPGSEGEALNK